MLIHQRIQDSICRLEFQFYDELISDFTQSNQQRVRKENRMWIRINMCLFRMKKTNLECFDVYFSKELASF